MCRSVLHTPHAATRMEDLAGGRHGVGELSRLERPAGRLEHHRAHTARLRPPVRPPWVHGEQVRARDRGAGRTLLYHRWERLSPGERDRLGALADNVKERALELRGTVDDGAAERELERASTELAEALGADEVAELREQLRQELERVDREQRARRAA